MRISVKRKIRKIISVVTVILWGTIIYLFSAQTSSESSKVSESFCYALADEYNTIFHQQLSEAQLVGIAELIEHPIRKGAHMTEYAVLALLIYQAFCAFEIRGKGNFFFTIAGVCLYAVTDEFHQRYVSGRSAQITDVLIDTLGGVFMLLLICLAKWLRQRWHKRVAGKEKIV